VNMRIRFCMATLAIILAAGPAYPQNRDILQLQKDMIDVMQRVNQLQTTVERDNALMKGLLEKTADSVNTISAVVQKMNQAIEGVRTQNTTTTNELRTALKTLNDTVKELQADVTSSRTQITSISRALTEMKTTAQPLEGPDDLWRDASVNYSSGLYDLAINGLQEFLSKFPTDLRAADAQLRIGDALSAQKKYDLAITQYDIVLQKYPESDKTRAALLKKGLAQAETNQPQAVSTLNEVAKKFPGTPEAISAQTKLKELASQRPRTPAK
jgi:tol-pal system protein YbgF